MEIKGPIKIIVQGPQGCGKTQVIHSVSKLLRLHQQGRNWRIRLACWLLKPYWWYPDFSKFKFTHGSGSEEYILIERK